MVLAERMFTRRDVVAVARKGQAPASQIAGDFGISESCLHRWLNAADVEVGHRPGVTSADSLLARHCRVSVTISWPPEVRVIVSPSIATW